MKGLYRDLIGIMKGFYRNYEAIMWITQGRGILFPFLFRFISRFSKEACQPSSSHRFILEARSGVGHLSWRTHHGHSPGFRVSGFRVSRFRVSGFRVLRCQGLGFRAQTHQKRVDSGSLSIWGSPEMRGTILGVPIIKIMVHIGLLGHRKGTIILGNYPCYFCPSRSHESFYARQLPQLFPLSLYLLF